MQLFREIFQNLYIQFYIYIYDFVEYLNVVLAVNSQNIYIHKTITIS